MGKKDGKRAAQLQQLADADPDDQFVKAFQKSAEAKKQKEQQQQQSQQKVQQPNQKKVDTSKLASAGEKRDRRAEQQQQQLKKKKVKVQEPEADIVGGENDDGEIHPAAAAAAEDNIPPPPDKNAPVEDWGNMEDDGEEDEGEGNADLQGLLKDAQAAGNGPLGVQTFDFSLGEPTEAAFLPVASFLDTTLYDNFVEKATGNHIMVDREDLFAAMLESPFTSVVQVDQNEEEQEEPEEEDDEDEIQPYANPTVDGEEELTTGIDQENDPDFFGILSVIDICRRRSKHISLKQLAALFDRPPVAVLQHGYTAKALFDTWSESEPSTPSPALLLINDRLQTVPADVCIQNLQFTLNSAANHMMETLEKVERGGGKKKGGDISKNLILHADPAACALVVMAKILRKGVRQEDEALEDSEAPAKKKQKTESTSKKSSSSSSASFNIDDFAFVREEDHLLWQVRSEKIAAVVHRFQPTRDQQPEHEIPLCVVFGVMFDEAMEVVGAGLEMEMMSDDEEDEEEEEE